MLIKYFLSHWAGQNSILLTLAGSLLLVRLVLGQLQLLVPTFAVLPWILFTLLVLVWQITGAFRCGDNYLKAHGGTVLYWVVQFTILATVTLAVLQVADVLSGRSQHKIRITSAVTEVPVLPLSRDGSAVTISGGLTWELRRAFHNTLEANTKIDTVILESEGGLVFVGRALALTIAEHGYSTHVESYCHSACTVAFMAGHKRTIKADGKLGFHRYKLENNHLSPGVSVANELEVDRARFAKSGVSKEFLDLLFETGHSDIWIPDHAVLFEAGVITDPLW